MKNKIFALWFGNLVLACFFGCDAKNFKVFWGIPSQSCRKYQINFSNLTKKYGIIQNINETSRGNKITILYDPGNFPALIEDSNRNLIVRNGGVPQNGDIDIHLESFEEQLETTMPNKTNSGLAIIDFESWRPIFRQNFEKFKIYKNYSIDLVKKKNPTWTREKVEMKAQMLFENAAHNFLNRTIRRAQKLRKYANWGYYGYPFCYNRERIDRRLDSCPVNVLEENDRIRYMFEESDVIYPSVYLTQDLEKDEVKQFVHGKIAEARRVAHYSKKPVVRVLAFVRYQYTDTMNYVNPDDMKSVLKTLKSDGADGAILWGMTNQLKTEQQCNDFKQYFDNYLGVYIKEILMKKQIL